MTHTMIFRRFFLLMMMIGVGLSACTPTTDPAAEPRNTPITKPADGSYPDPDQAVLDEYPAPVQDNAQVAYPEPNDEPSDLVVGDVDQSYILGEGDTVTLGSGEEMTFVGVLDSRCPEGTACVQEGSLVVNLEILTAEGTTEPLPLSLDDRQVTAEAILPSGFPIVLINDGTRQVEQGNERKIRVLVGHMAVGEDGSQNQVVDNAGTVETLDVLLLESFPLRAMVSVSGYFSNGCWSLEEVTAVQADDMVFEVNVRGRHSGAEICTEALVPFEETVELPINQLPAGVYTVVAGAQTTTFELQVDNMLELPDQKPNIQIGEADVTDASVVVDEAAGVLEVTVIGYLRDGCTNIQDMVIGEMVDNTLPVTITTARDANMMCTMALVDYEETFEIPLAGRSLDNLSLDINGFVVDVR